MARVAVIIVNFNSGARLARCLDCLAQQSRTDFETFVVDNASTDGSQNAALNAPIPVRLIASTENLGFAAANNRAAQATDAEWLVFLNPDAYASPDWLERLLDGAARYPFADAFGSTQINADNDSLLDGVGDVFTIFGMVYRGGFGWPKSAALEDGECFSPCAAAAMWRASAFAALGGFDERFFCYGEDVDLGFRLRLRGGRSVQIAAARVLHEGSGISGPASDFTIYHGNRNRIWLTYKNLPAALYWPTAPLRLFSDLYLLARSWSAGLGPSYLRALKHGYGRLGLFAKSRRDIQRTRKIGAMAVAQQIEWSPGAISHHAPKLNRLD